MESCYYAEGHDPVAADPADIEIGESICAICDDGGELTSCDGPCLRSFHATPAAAAKSDSKCTSLGLTEYSVLLTQKFFCNNCKLKKHQCFACGMLGRSDPEDASPEVFLCGVPLCGRFYHLKCLPEKVDSKQGFACPLHRCRACGRPESQESEKLRLYPCRRCPRAWHRSCVNSKFIFSDEDNDYDEEVRGWIVGETRFLYCLRHRIDPSLCTPPRDHLRFGATISGLAKPGSKRSTLKLSDAGTSHRPSVTDLPQFSQAEVDDVVQSLKQRSKAVLTEEAIANKLIQGYQRQKMQKFGLGRAQSLVKGYFLSLELIRAGKPQEAQSYFNEEYRAQLRQMQAALIGYLAPIRFGHRYSSFGRHFTKINKLQEVVDLLHWYVQPHDTIADLCCGTNDFSSLLSKKLQSMKKEAYFRNFDIIQPANTFQFERRDYNTIGPEMLPPSDKLILGLNPPFGYRAATASKFVELLVKFLPKIIILIAPPETSSPDPNLYERIWFDDRICQGEAFYLPGSVDMSGNIMDQMNNATPHLTLWARIDWGPECKRIAAETGHLKRFCC